MARPWWLLIAAKLLLSRVPLSYRFFASIGVFRHGRMHNPTYAIDTFARHFERADTKRCPEGFVALEFGIGDSIASAILARARGAAECYLVDAGRFAVEDLASYRAVVTTLRKHDQNCAAIVEPATFETLLEQYGGTYLTEGLTSLKQIPDNSVDFAWSNAVLEHVRVGEFLAVQKELHRIVKPGGTVSHRIDLKDHLGGALNNRRIASTLWERDWFAKSGFYTNRLSFDEMLVLFEKAGFEVEVLQVDRWKTLPTPIEKMSKEFHHYTCDDLRISGFDVLLRPARVEMGAGR